MFFNYHHHKYHGAKPVNTRKAISPILATVIIIAVTLVIAIGVIGWIMGIWGTFGSTESLQIYPDSYINVSKTPKMYLHVKNLGTAAAVIKKIEVIGVGSVSNLNLSTISPGKDVIISGNVNNNTIVTAGASYQVKVYTAAGNVYSAVVQAKQG